MLQDTRRLQILQCTFNNECSLCWTLQLVKKDVSMAVKELKSDKSDVEGRVSSNNYIHGTDHLFMYLSFLFSSMINHGYAPATYFIIKYGSNTQGCRS